jgi:hypothetical protein
MDSLSDVALGCDLRLSLLDDLDQHRLGDDDDPVPVGDNVVPGSDAAGSSAAGF